MTTESQPLLRVTQGAATAEDLAALIALFGALATTTHTEQTANDIHAWNSKERMFRHFPIPGPGAWRASGLAQ